MFLHLVYLILGNKRTMKLARTILTQKNLTWLTIFTFSFLYFPVMFSLQWQWILLITLKTIKFKLIWIIFLNLTAKFFFNYSLFSNFMTNISIFMTLFIILNCKLFLCSRTWSCVSIFFSLKICHYKMKKVLLSQYKIAVYHVYNLFKKLKTSSFIQLVAVFINFSI